MSYHVSSIALRQARATRRNRNNVRFNDTSAASLGPVSNVMTLALILALLGLLYLTQVTKTNGYSYQVDQLQRQRTSLVEEQQSLEVEAARLQAIERVRTSEVAKDLGEPASVEFVQ